MSALLTIDEFAEQAQVSRRTTQRWIADGLIPARRIGARTIRIPASALDTAGEPIGAAS